MSRTTTLLDFCFHINPDGTGYVIMKYTNKVLLGSLSTPDSGFIVVGIDGSWYDYPREDFRVDVRSPYSGRRMHSGSHILKFSEKDAIHMCLKQILKTGSSESKERVTQLYYNAYKTCPHIPEFPIENIFSSIISDPWHQVT
jgi:hypothetical protein